eukprot:scaffold350_cov333-Pavlova_lutheri.AAC.3
MELNSHVKSRCSKREGKHHLGLGHNRGGQEWRALPGIPCSLGRWEEEEVVGPTRKDRRGRSRSTVPASGPRETQEPEILPKRAVPCLAWQGGKSAQ